MGCSARAVPNLCRLAAAGTTIVEGARVSRVSADILKRASIAVVGVDAADLSTVVGCGALDINVALALARALFQKEKQKVSN